MRYISNYHSPLGNILLASDGDALTGLWFDGQKYFPEYFDKESVEHMVPVFEMAKSWLDTYFSGIEPDFTVPVHFSGTAFQNEIWELLCSIPYGETATYGDLAKIIAKRRGLAHMSAQAVGGAVGRNSISIIVPCHRVIGSGGKLTGYAGGIDKKLALLRLEKIPMFM